MRISTFLKIILLAFSIIAISCSDDSGDANTNQNLPLQADNSLYELTRHEVTVNICSEYFCGIEHLIFIDESIGYAVTGVDLYKTLDSGTTWNIILNQDITGPLIPLTEDLQFLNTYGAIKKTTNGGESWTNISRPLVFVCPDSEAINVGTVQFVDGANGFILDNCYKKQLYKTNNTGADWEIIYESEQEITEYYFQDSMNGFVGMNDLIYITENGGSTWVATSRLPSVFDYVIQGETKFLFPEGSANVNMPDLVSETVTVREFSVNQNGDIAVLLYDEAPEIEHWSLWLYTDSRSWELVDTLDNLSGQFARYSSVYLTQEQAIYVSVNRSGEITRYYLK